MPARYGSLGGGATTSPATTQQSALTSDPPVLHEWWKTFDDPTLISLCDRALRANHELHIAELRVREARAIERGVRSNLLPTIGIGASYARSLGSSNGIGFPFGLPGEAINLYEIGFDATYEVDVFGGVRRSVEAASAGTEAVEEVRHGVQTTLIGDLARSYINLRASQRRLEIARSNLQAQQKTLGIVERRFLNGLATNFDQLRARAQLESTQSTIPPLDASIRQSIYTLSVLLGEQPMSLVDELAVRTPTPPNPPVVPIGLPSDLLRQRPDIRRAERTLAAETAAQGVAVAALFPSVVLGGAAGVQSRDVSKVFDGGRPSSGYYLAEPMAHWTLFDGGRRKANIDRTNARAQAALAEYEETILVALRDVESALTVYRSDQVRRETLGRLVEDNTRAVDIAQRQYEQGLVTLLDVLEVQRNLFASEDALAVSNHSVWTDLVTIYKALGGGWQQPEAATDKPAEKTDERP
jgi:NodT family efflux transporter outer membrane factor (OMF) lipoprotein